MRIPFELTAGDSIAWDDCAFRDNLGNSIDSETWSMSYVFQGPTSLAIAAVSNGAGWRTSISTVSSAALLPGVYYWQSFVTKGAERINHSSGQLKVKQDLSQGITTPYDGRTQSEKDLDAVQVAIRAMISGGAVAEYTIGNRSVRKMALADLLQLESMLKARIFREQKEQRIANGLGNPSNVFVRFTK